MDSREARVRSREMSISRSVPAAPAPVVDEESKFIEAQNFFGMGFREGMRKGQLGEEFNPSELGNMFKFYFGSGLKRREYGGPVLKGESYLVGEDGPEVYTASNDGKITPNNLLPDLPGLGGGGGGTDAITGKAKSKTLGAYMSDAFKISTIPARFLLGIKSPEDPLSKFAAPSTPEDKVSSAISSYNQMIQPNIIEQNNVNTIASSINQSVGQSSGMTTVIQPVVNNVPVPTPVPQPTPVPVKGKNNTIVIDGKNKNTLAKLIR